MLGLHTDRGQHGDETLSDGGGILPLISSPTSYVSQT